MFGKDYRRGFAFLTKLLLKFEFVLAFDLDGLVAGLAFDTGLAFTLLLLDAVAIFRFHYLCLVLTKAFYHNCLI